MINFKVNDIGNPPVTLETVKSYLRIEHNSEDELISKLINTACEHIENRTRRSLLTQERRLVTDERPAKKRIYLKKPPITSINNIVIYDNKGSATTIPDEDYSAVLNSNHPYVILPDYACSQKATNGIEIDYNSGYLENTTPKCLETALINLVAHWYSHREAVTLGVHACVIPEGFNSLIAPYKVFSL